MGVGGFWGVFVTSGEVMVCRVIECIGRVFDGVWWGEWVGDDGDDGDDGLMGFVCEMNWVGVERVRVQREALTDKDE